MIVIVEGQPNKIVAVSGSTPMIDGVIGGEWSDASSLSFNNTEVFVKQDGENLYIAFNVSDPTPNANENVHIFFDVNHDEGTTPKSDDIVISVFRNGTLVEGYLVNGTYVNATGWTASVYNTTQLCSRCGKLVPKTLATRIHRCPYCGLVLARDHNSAITILHRSRSYGASRASSSSGQGLSVEPG